MWFTRISIHNPVMATMAMAALLVVGLFAYYRLPIDQYPDLNFPVVVVTAKYPGASPEIVEAELTRPLETAINTLSGLKTLTSRSYEGTSVIIAEFDLLTNSAAAAQDVREKVALVRPALRDEISEPVITRFNPDDFPIASVLIEPVKANTTLRETTLLADQVIKKRIENVRGVGAANLVGGATRQLLIELDPVALDRLSITPQEVMQVLSRDNQTLPLGRLKTTTTEAVVELNARLDSANDFNNLIVTIRNGRQVRLGELGRIRDGEKTIESLALVNGKPVVSVDVLKAQDANSVDVVDDLKEALTDIEKELHGEVKLSLTRDQSKPIRNSLLDVRNTLIEGALLTVVIVFLFLGSWRSTVITGLTLPISLIGTFSVLYAMGFTINLLTLLAMSICVGLLIDDAIVVRENIVRHLQMGKDHKEAALEGTREIGLAVLATTFSIVAVFLPVGFMGGIIGQFFHQFGITVACAVLLSMFVSFTLDPMLSSVWYDPQAHGQGYTGRMGRLLNAFQNLMLRLEQGYVRLLKWGLRWPKTVIAIALASFFASFGLLKFVGVEFTPQPDNSELSVSFHTPEGSPLELTQRKALQVEAMVRQHPEVTTVYTTINTGFASGKNYATVFVKLVPRNQRKITVAKLSTILRTELKSIAGVAVTQVGQQVNVSSGKPVQVSVLGPELSVLEKLSGQIQTLMEADPRLVDLESSLKPTKPTVRVNVDRARAADFGIDVSSINATIEPLMSGKTVSTWRAPNEENYDVVVQLPEAGRQSIEQLARLPLRGNTSQTVRLGDIAHLEPGFAAAQINRKYLTREVLLTANVQGAAAGTVSQALQTKIAQLNLPPGYRISYGGSTKDIKDTLGFALQALILAIVFIYLILASQFASFVQPLVIMMSLPLSLIGVILALLVFGSTLNIFSIIGFVMLMGLVTKNAILLVDFVNQALRQGTALRDALIQAAETRLRPILMTTLAMVFGMLPLALAQGEGSEQRSPMAHAVIGGVITSTLLTLLVVPVLIWLLENAKARRLQKKRLRESRV
ncbi:efflux RND transporter permease subunit [Limnobacter humi]|uniref:Efflux RND transporter permease subunit n=1 Tax=Limnobacter humi TaxID=1778671 RepID=A0ABT1WCE6_9BURK|nr:efflux RND transporter permease subunit [Limnobacter humi]MCQ8895185.1 efflux RND transporter permease subunit [Limnobacter humi]